MKYKTSSSNELEEKIMPTVEELIDKNIITVFANNVLLAHCQKCGKDWILRFNRVSKLCCLCKCKNWWCESGKRGRPKK